VTDYRPRAPRPDDKNVDPEHRRALDVVLSKLARWERSNRTYQECCAEAEARKAAERT
jgi:hypothetical protein